MNDGFPAFALTEEHEVLREAVRALADDKIAPRAAEIDATAEFPWDVHEALVKADFQAVHVPEEYGGAGADAIATVIVIEEIARVCASSSLIPAVNKLGTMPLILAGSDELKARYLPPVARGEAMFSYAPVRARGGQRRGVDEDPGGARRRRLRAERTASAGSPTPGSSNYYTVMAVTDPDGGRQRHLSAFVVEDGDAGLHVRSARAQARHQGLADP